MSERTIGDAIQSPEFDKNRVDLTLRFDPHATRHDWEGLEDDLRRGGFDIYIPEMVGRGEADEDVLRKLARGDSKIYQRLQADLEKEGMSDSIYAAQFGALFNTHVNLFFADSTDEQVTEDSDLGEFGKPVEGSSFSDFEDFLATCVERTIDGVRLLQKRDPLIASNIDAGLGVFIEQHPKLSKMDSVRVLATLGDMHSFLLPKILETLGYKPIVKGRPEIQDMTAAEEAEVRLLRGEDVDERLWLESAANGVLWGHIYHPYTAEKRKIMRSLTSSLNEDVIKALFENYLAQGTPWLHAFTQGWLEKLNIVDADLALVDPNM